MLYFADCDDLTIQTQRPERLFRSVGETVTLECNAPCEPIRNVILYRDSSSPEILKSEITDQLTHDHRLQKEDNDVHFYCEVDGSRTGSVFFDVRCKYVKQTLF